MTEIKPCAHCGDPMKHDEGTFGHTDSNSDCILAKQAWAFMPRYITAWNQRAPDPALITGLREARDKLAAGIERADDTPNMRISILRHSAAEAIAHLDTLLAQEGQP